MRINSSGHQAPTLARSSARFLVWVGLVGLTALLIFTIILRPTANDVELMAIFLSITAIISVAVGFAIHRFGWVQRSPRLQLTLITGYLLASLLTFLNVWITARLMFTSQHDLLLATVLLVFAGGIAMILGAFYSQDLTSRIARLNHAAHLIASGNYAIRVSDPGRDELADLSSSFNHMAAVLETSDKKQQELDQLRRELVAWAGHDLRTPLASLRAIIEALSDGLVEDPSSTQRYLEAAKKDVHQLTLLIDDQFQMAQLDSGGLQLDLAPGSLIDLFSDTLESFLERASKKRLTLEGQLEPGIDIVWMDTEKIGRVMNNLLENAIRYTPMGGYVHLHAIQENKGIKVLVTNSGSPIPVEDLPHLFERFYRGEKSRSRETGGSGLGLAIAKAIVDAHGGQIDVSQTDRDICFSFTLPGN